MTINNLIERVTNQLRQKTKYWLVNNKIYENCTDIFGEAKVPIMCDFINEYVTPFAEVYESGNRSIFFQKGNLWIKAKGIGIPTGYTRPFYNKGRIYTYQLLDDPGMCHKSILWGFLTKEEFLCELYGISKAEKIGQKIKLMGYTLFDKVYCIKMKNRAELFYKLKSKDLNERLNIFHKGTIKTTAYSIYISYPSDIRVKELLITFIFPQILKLIDTREIKEYVKWLGASCGFLLKTFHDSGALHGTWLGKGTTPLGLLDVHSNSYTGNYIVDEEELIMCDFDLSKPIKKESYKDIEKWSLIHMENPLYYAGSFSPKDALNQNIAKKNPFRERLAELFKKAVMQGYQGNIYQVENKWKREMLSFLVSAKNLLYGIYDIRRELTGQIDYIDYVIASTKISQKRFREARLSFNL